MKKNPICPKCGNQEDFIADRWATECLKCHTRFDEQRVDETNNEIKLSEKLYQETLDELVTKVWRYKYYEGAPIPSWNKFIEYVGESGSNKDIEKAVKLAIQKTYDALQAGKLTEAGQSLYDRRKDIEAHTAKKILNDAKHFVFKINYDNDISEEEQIQIDFYMAEVVEQYSAFLNNLKKKYEVD